MMVDWLVIGFQSATAFLKLTLWLIALPSSTLTREQFGDGWKGAMI
jgi:hypothetical protein